MNRGIIDQEVNTAMKAGKLILSGQEDGGLKSLLDFVFDIMNKKAVMTTVGEIPVPPTPRPPAPAPPPTPEQAAAAIVARGKRGAEDKGLDGTGEALEKQHKAVHDQA